MSALAWTDLIFEMWNSIPDAQKLRGFHLSSMGVVVKLRRGFIPVVVRPLSLVLLRRGDESKIAMGGKVFGAPGRPTELEPLQLSWRDAVAVALIVAAAAGVYAVKFA